MNTLHPAFSRHAHGHGPVAQRGAALLVALILLVVITLVGLAAIGTTLLQNKAASNQYDRQVAFQSAEAALRAATALIDTHPTGLIWHNCQLGSVECLPNPFDDTTLTTADIHTVAIGNVAGDFAAGNLAAAQPQYVIENLGNWVDYENDTGCRQTANAHNNPSGCPPGNAVYYRITARSGDPAVVGNRAVVTLQVIVKQG